MYSNNIIPQYNYNMQPNKFGLNRRSNDRFIGGGFAVPFLLGGITGGLLARPNSFGGGYPVPSPYPVPMPYYVNNSYPYPTSYSENYYYY